MLKIKKSSYWRALASLLGLALLVTASPVLAVLVPDLYVAEVLVTSRDDTQLTRGARAGLLQVLVRVSGSRTVENSPQVVAALQHPEEYFYQYSYESTDRSFQIGDAVVPARILRLTFEPSVVARLLREAGFSIWGSNRPSVLVWLAFSDPSGRRLLGEHDNSALLTALNTRARLRGLPLLYPLLDLEDAASLSSAEVWGAFLGEIGAASSRYNPDVVLSGRVQQDGSGQWSGFWSYRLDQNWREYSNTGFSADDLIAGMMDQLADALAQRYALDASRGSVILQIDGIHSLADYAGLSHYLETLTPVLDSSVLEVDGEEVLFRLITEGQIQQLIEIIRLDEKMLLVNQGYDAEGQAQLVYRWLL